MLQIDGIAALRQRLTAARRSGQRIALVPTMGALHEGHLSLVDDARVHAELVVMSLFVNPLQFRPGEDFERYPRDLVRDSALAAARGVDILFAPTVGEMYGAGRELRIVAGESALLWEGAVRPGHFDGVLTVVAKLFNIVQPDVACFGQKDIQQVTLIRQMVRQLDFPLELSVVPTKREPDGLAMSSRNVYLSAADRVAATSLCRALRAVEAAWVSGVRDAETLRGIGMAIMRQTDGVTADYIAVTDGERMLPVEQAPPGTIVAVAARVGSTRLIDNVILA